MFFGTYRPTTAHGRRCTACSAGGSAPVSGGEFCPGCRLARTPPVRSPGTCRWTPPSPGPTSMRRAGRDARLGGSLVRNWRFLVQHTGEQQICSQSDAEFGFRQLKDPHVVSFSPMHHWTDHHIRVHTQTCVFALMTAHLMRRQAEHAGQHLSVRERGTTRPPRRHPRNRDDLPRHWRTTQGPPDAHRDHPHPRPPRRNLRATPLGTTHLGHTLAPPPNPAPPAQTPAKIMLARKLPLVDHDVWPSGGHVSPPCRMTGIQLVCPRWSTSWR
jgi:hypothetical protein